MKKQKITEREWEARCDLAACYHLCNYNGISDRINTHISARIPKKNDQFLLNPIGLLFDEINATNLVSVYISGAKVDVNHPFDFNPAGYLIHSAVLEARPEIFCIIHHHSIAGIAIGALKEGLLPVSQHAMQFYGKVSYHEYKGFGTSNEDEKSRIANDLGENNILFMRNHGVLVCGNDVGQAYCLMDDLEKACKAQLAILSTSQSRHIPNDEVAKLTAEQFEKIGRPGGEKEWPAMRRFLDRIGSKYKE